MEQGGLQSRGSGRLGQEQVRSRDGNGLEEEELLGNRSRPVAPSRLRSQRCDPKPREGVVAGSLIESVAAFGVIAWSGIPSEPGVHTLWMNRVHATVRRADRTIVCGKRIDPCR